MNEKLRNKNKEEEEEGGGCIVKLQIIQDPSKFKEEIIAGFRSELKEFAKNFEPKTPPEYLTRQETAILLSCNLATLYNWKAKGLLKTYGIGGRVYYKRSDIEEALEEN